MTSNFFTSRYCVRLLLMLLITVKLEFSGADAAKILMLFVQFPSHAAVKLTIASELVSRNHEVHVILHPEHPLVEPCQRNGVKVIGYQPVPDLLQMFSAEFEHTLAAMIFNGTREQLWTWDLSFRECDAMMSDRSFLERLKEYNFDFAIVESFTTNPCHLLVPNYLGLRYATSSVYLPPWLLRLPAIPSFYAVMIGGRSVMEYPTLQTLSQRLANFGKYVMIHLRIPQTLWGDKSLIRKYAADVNSYEELILRSELILIENDHHLDSAMPLLPHVVAVGGITARPPQPLADDLEIIMAQSGDDGVILASFGSFAYRMPSGTVTKFLDAFRRLKETVLTRMAVPVGFQVPENVHLTTWHPQNDILGHPKTRLFITHCGSNGQYEALYHGVPMLGIPMFAEQSWNCVRAQHRNIARCLHMADFTADELYSNIRELIDNVTYRSNVRKMSARWRDEPMIGREKAGFWFDHVIRYGGDHLRSQSVNQPLYQFFMLDIIGLMVIILLVCVTLTCCLMKCRVFSKIKRKAA